MTVRPVQTPRPSRPSGPIEGLSAWYGANMRESDDWVYRLTPDDVAEVEAAVACIRRRGLDIASVAREGFELPGLGPVLAEIQEDVVTGRGFALIRNLPVERYSIEQAALAFWGIGSYFGAAVSQNAKGHLLGHVKDIGLDPENPHHRIYATSARHLFHTDSCDIVGLLCLRPAMRGGLSSVASSVTIHNEMLQRRPDLAELLFEPFCVDRKGEIPEGKLPYYRLPIFNYHAGNLSTIYARDFIEGAQRFEDVPRLTAAQTEAMDMLDALAGEDGIRLDMELAAGDMQFLHNHQTLHARTEYEDYPEPERKRHLLRLWLSPPNGRPLPPAFAERYGNIEVGVRRGGIRVAGATPYVPLEAE